MSLTPIIAFGQQPCGFFPRRYLLAKIRTARRLRDKIGGEIVYFFHDSDHDPRETRTILHHRKTGEPALLNFTFENRWQRKFSPLYCKRLPADWHPKTLLQLPNYVEHPVIEIFRETQAATVADFCLEMYGRMDLLHGIRVVRSSDRNFRLAACEVEDFFLDVPYQGEIVRARFSNKGLTLHEGGDVHVPLAVVPYGKEQVSPTRDTRFRWMQSVLHCTHYIAGLGEQAYIRQEEAPEVLFLKREEIDRSEEAYTEIGIGAPMTLPAVLC